MIHALELGKDAIGFPVVSWREDRNLYSPEAFGDARVECRILKAGDDLAGITSGTLLFCARGSTRHGRFEEARPWETLSGFAVKRPQELQRREDQSLATAAAAIIKDPIAKAAAQHIGADHAWVIEAQFGPYGEPITINCAEATGVDINRVHRMLVRQFQASKIDAVAELNDQRFALEASDTRIETYRPGRAGWHSPAPSFRDRIKPWLLPVAVAAAIFGGLAWWTWWGGR